MFCVSTLSGNLSWDFNSGTDSRMSLDIYFSGDWDLPWSYGFKDNSDPICGQDGIVAENVNQETHLCFSAKIRSNDVIAGYGLPPGNGLQELSVSIDKDTLRGVVMTQNTRSDEIIDYNWLTLDDNAFLEFLGDITIHTRSDSAYTGGGSVVSESLEWMPVTWIDGVKFLDPAPEPAFYAMILGLSAFFMVIALKRRRKKGLSK